MTTVRAIGIHAAAQLLVLCSWTSGLSAQTPDSPPAQPRAAATTQPATDRGVFVGYETLEMSMNRFKHFAGEIGYRFGATHQLRLSIMEVDLTERHLASKWESAAVEGRGVKGYFRGYELHADRFFRGNWYLSANVGYYADTYEHVTLPERVHSRTMTIGTGIGYSRANLFGVPHLTLNFSNPVRFYFNGIKQTTLGEATVRRHKIVPNTWLFLGYRF